MDAGVPRTSVQKLYLLDGTEKFRPGICSGVLVLVEFSPRGEFLITGGLLFATDFHGGRGVICSLGFPARELPFAGVFF